MVEQLLQFLVSIIDAQLLKAVELEDFETGDIQDTNEAGTLTLGAVKRSVDTGHNPLESLSKVALERASTANSTCSLV